MSSVFPYEYFSGSNVVVEIGDSPLHEAAGISLQIQEGKIPLYGYSSRHFDAVGRGKVIVQGSLLINFVHKDYLLANIQASVEGTGGSDFDYSVLDQNQQLQNTLKDDASREAILQLIKRNPRGNAHYIAALQQHYWGAGLSSDIVGLGQHYGGAGRPERPSDIVGFGYNPHDLGRPLSIKITFGERRFFNNFNGVTGLTLSAVHFMGQGKSIQINESVIVEEYQFIARNIHAVTTANALSATGAGGEPSIDAADNDLTYHVNTSDTVVSYGPDLEPDFGESDTSDLWEPGETILYPMPTQEETLSQHMRKLRMPTPLRRPAVGATPFSPMFRSRPF